MNDELKKYVKYKISISKIKEEEEKIMIKRKNFINMRIGIVACACLVLITGGVVFAKDIENFIKDKFGLGQGVETAVENGYISSLEDTVEFINSEVSVTQGNSEEVLDTFDTGIRITDFLMTDTTVTFNMEIKFDEKINQYKNLKKNSSGDIDYYDIGSIVLDLFVLDEENKLICSPFKEDEFNSYCREHNLSLEFLEFNENYLNCVANCNIKEVDSETNTIKMTCVINGDEMPKSKELNLYFSKITFESKGALGDISKYVFLEGNWEIKLEVPEYMYNREDTFYKVVSCDNKDFDIYTAKATEIGFEVGVLISNVELNSVPEIIINPETGMDYIFNSKEELEAISTDPEFEKAYVEYQSGNHLIRTAGYPGVNWLPYTDGCYILDSNGKKYEISSNNTKKQDANYVYSGKSADRVFLNQFNFYNEFTMTKYDATDKITMFIDYKGEPVKIELEKIKN